MKKSQEFSLRGHLFALTALVLVNQGQLAAMSQQTTMAWAVGAFAAAFAAMTLWLYWKGSKEEKKGN